MINHSKESKFTKGEKCIFYHIIATIALTLALVVVYFGHLCFVKHSPAGVLSVSRRSAIFAPEQDKNNSYIGSLYLIGTNERAVCTTLLVRSRWSLAPAHCAAARSDPTLAAWLPLWTIRYISAHSDIIDTAVTRSITHPHFSREDFSNNIALLQHEREVFIGYDFIQPFSYRIDDNEFLVPNSVELLGHYQTKTSNTGSLKKRDVRHIARDSCSGLIDPVTSLRPYEHCFVPTSEDIDTCFDHGAPLAINSQIFGFFAWSEKCGKSMFPFIVLSINDFEEWLQHITLS